MENLGGGVWHSPGPISKRNPLSSESIEYPIYREIPRDPKAMLALALYREAKTVNSIPFSFLSYFKILNIFWKDKKDSEGKNEIVEGLRTMLPRLTDQEALERLTELSKREKDVPNYLYQSGRCAVAHAFAEPIVDPDDVADLRRLSQDMWVIQAVAEYLIETKLNVCRDILAVG